MRCLLFLVLGATVNARADIITTFVGKGGRSGFAGDGGNATSALLNNPSGVCVDGGGGYFIADKGNGRVRHLYSNGTIVTAANFGALTFPEGIAWDRGSGAFVAVYNRYTIYHIFSNGSVFIAAGTGLQGSTGDGESAYM
jgi:hypothetical protein